MSLGQMRFKAVLKIPDLSPDIGLQTRRNILFGKIDGGFQIGTGPEQARPPVLIKIPKRATHLSQSLVPLCRRLRIDQVRQAFSRRQVHLVVFESPSGELTGFSQAKPVKARQSAQNPVNNRPPAMHLQFNDVFTGKAFGRRKPQGQRFIQQLTAIRIAQRNPARPARERAGSLKGGKD